MSRRWAIGLTRNWLLVRQRRRRCGGADIVVTATSAAGPVLLVNDLEPGMHVVAMGSNNPVHGEVEAAAVARADRVFVDDLDGAHVEGGDLMAAERGRRIAVGAGDRAWPGGGRAGAGSHG